MKSRTFPFLLSLIFLLKMGMAQNIQNDSIIRWKALPNPVYTDPDDDFAKDPSVLKTRDKFYMFYTGATPGAQGQGQWNFTNWQIEYATSPDGLNWTKQGISFKADSSGWETGRVQAPSRPIWYKGKYYMFYTGGPRTPKNLIYTGYATSKDLVHWTKSPKIIPQNVDRANDISIFREGKIFYMFYTTYTNDGEPVFYRTSSDLENWSEPINTGAFGEGSSVWKENGTYYIVGCHGYSGKGEIYRLYSSSKLTGFKDRGLVLADLPAFALDSYGHGDVVKNGAEYWFYFQGTSERGKTFKIGLATTKIQ